MFKNNKKVKIIILIFIIVILFILFISSVIFSLINIFNTNILNGISICGIDVSNMSKEDAIKTISEAINNKSSNNIIVSISSDLEKNVTFDSLDIEYDINSCIEKALEIGRSGNIFENNFEILNLILNKKNIDIDFTINDDKLTSVINDISANLPNKLIQSSYYIENNNLIITKGTSGDIIDSEDFKTNLNAVLKDLTLTNNYIVVKSEHIDPNNIDIDKIYNEIYQEPKNAYYEKNPLKVYSEVKGISFDKDKATELLQNNQDEYIIELNYVYPQITVNDLDIDIFKDTLSYFTTKYDKTNKPRSTNLELAASKIDGTILSPGEEFSYNTIVGARTIESGYKEAKIYSNGQVIDGLGGGICQISSTLYNSVIYANLDVTERYNHQFITSYVKPGRDATVVYGVKDLKFVNNRSYPIKIELKVANGVVICAIYGIKEDTEYDVDFDIETLSTTDPPIQYEYDKSVPLGKEEIKQNGSNGTVVKVYKIVKLNGSVVSKTLLSQDTYNPLEKIVIKNPDTN